MITKSRGILALQIGGVKSSLLTTFPLASESSFQTSRPFKPFSIATAIVRSAPGLSSSSQPQTECLFPVR